MVAEVSLDWANSVMVPHVETDWSHLITETVRVPEMKHEVVHRHSNSVKVPSVEFHKAKIVMIPTVEGGVMNQASVIGASREKLVMGMALTE